MKVNRFDLYQGGKNVYMLNSVWWLNFDTFHISCCRRNSSDSSSLLSLLLEVSEFGEELSANVYRLDGETRRWEVETTLPVRRSHHCLAVLGGFIFAVGGSSSREHGENAACNLLYRYDPRHNIWTSVRYQTATSTPLNTLFDFINRMFMSYTEHTGCKHTNSKLVLQGAPMNEQRVDFYLGVVGQRLIAVGGRNDIGALSSVEVYNPAEDCWSFVAELPR